LKRGVRSALEVVYEDPIIGNSFKDAGYGNKHGNVWAYTQLLPLESVENIQSLGEGGTPLLRLELPSDHFDLPFVFVKNEGVNPTCSYKDRANTVTVSVARELGFKKVVASSTGNHGCSLAAYAASADLECIILCHEEASQTVMNIMQFFGAQMVVGGPRTAFLSTLVHENDWFPAATIVPFSDVCSPYGVEGFKTIAYEIFEQLGNVIPDAVFVPVGSGDGLYGIWKGFRELKEKGLTRNLPRMYGCQEAGCAPLVRSFREGRKDVITVSDMGSIALSIREPTSSSLALRAVYESGGAAIDCSPSEIEEIWRYLGMEGLFVETASAVPLACALKLTQIGHLESIQNPVCVLTGAGIKWPEFLNAHARAEPIVATNDLDGHTLVSRLLKK
jgi:threonine synthase